MRGKKKQSYHDVVLLTFSQLVVSVAVLLAVEVDWWRAGAWFGRIRLDGVDDLGRGRTRGGGPCSLAGQGVVAVADAGIEEQAVVADLLDTDSSQTGVELARAGLLRVVAVALNSHIFLVK